LNEPVAVQQLLNSDAPATQTTGSLATGDYVLWQNGAGSSDLTAGTATISTTGSATDGSPLTFTVTGAGTVNVTITGAPDENQLEGGSVPTTFILSAGGTVQRNATDFQVTPNPLPVNDFQIRGRFVADNVSTSPFLFHNYVDANAEISIKVHGGKFRVRKEVGAVSDSLSSIAVIENGVVYNFGASFSSVDGMAISLNGDTPVTNTNVTDMVLNPTSFIGQERNLDNQVNGGVPDLTINTDMSDADWYKDTTWDDAE
jgi:hypothetical protein